jgi:4'-phosphopantetheinyl transferase
MRPEPGVQREGAVPPPPREAPPSPSFPGRRSTVPVGGSSGVPRAIADVWCVRRAPDDATASAWWDLLGPAEREEARARRFDRDRLLYLTAHAAKRVVLAPLVGAQPSDLEFEIHSRGKPRLAGMFAGCGVEFNLSHSADLVLVAVIRGRAIGVDVERHDARAGIRDLGESFLSPGERRTLSGMAEPDRTARLFQVWTRKEAALKALGCGLDASLADLEVGAGLRANGGLARFDSGGPEEVFVEDLPCPEGYSASIAVA